MQEKQIVEEVKDRIQKEIDFYKSKVPENVSLVWHGYLAALLDRGLISHYAHSDLVDILPKISQNPVYSIFTGIPGDHLKLK